jgi:hypothetical protein
MNLSSYLQMPPAPPVTKTPNTASVQGTATGVGLDAGASLGLDFAKIMARQFERLPQLQRQAFAAPSPNTGDATPRAKPEAQDTRVADRQAQDALDDGREADQARADAQDVPHHASAKKPTGVARKASDPHTDASEAGVPQAVTTAATANPTPGAPEVQPRALHANPYLKDVALPSSDASAPTPLRTVELSPHMRIITDPRKAPSPESLTAFAKSMGLDEEAIQKLMGADHAAPAVPAPLASTAGSSELSAANNAAMAAAADKMAQPLSDAQVAKLSA